MPFFAFVTVLALGLAAVAGPEQEPAAIETGSLHGMVEFDGGKAPRRVVTANTVIYLEPVEDEKTADGEGIADNADEEGSDSQRSKAMALLDQVDITFDPHVLVVVAGEPVQVRNSDVIVHNVHTKSANNPAFNRAQLPGIAIDVVFKRPEIIHVGCDIHSQMSAFIVVVPTPHFAKAGKKGTFEIQNIVPGKYNVVAWHEKYGKIDVEQIEIQPGQRVELNVNFPRPRRSKSR